MPEENPLNVTTPDAGHFPLRGSLVAVRFVILMCAVLCLLSAAMFLFQVRYREPFGGRFVDQPGAWPHLFGHLLRCAIGGVLAWNLWKYLRAARQTAIADPRQFFPLVRSLSLWWNSLAVGILVLVVYALWVTFVTGPLVVNQSLSPRFAAESPEVAAVQVEFRLAELESEDGLTEATEPHTARTIYLHEEPLLTNEDIAEARVFLTDRGQPAISVTFVPTVHERVLQATIAHFNKPLGILIDGRLVSAPILRGPISSSAAITGGFSREEAERIAKGITGRSE